MSEENQDDIVEVVIGKKYLVGNYLKKTYVEREFFRHESNPNWIVTVEVGWRGGQVLITPTNQDEVDQLNNAQYAESDQEFDPYSFEEFEPDSTWDGCWTDYFFSGSMPEEEQERVQAALEEDGDDGEEWLGYFSLLEERLGYRSFDMDTIIYGRVWVQSVEDES